jgi:hypothetical protein
MFLTLFFFRRLERVEETWKRFYLENIWTDNGVDGPITMRQHLAGW